MSETFLDAYGRKITNSLYISTRSPRLQVPRWARVFYVLGVLEGEVIADTTYGRVSVFSPIVTSHWIPTSPRHLLKGVRYVQPVNKDLVSFLEDLR